MMLILHMDYAEKSLNIVKQGKIPAWKPIVASVSLGSWAPAGKRRPAVPGSMRLEAIDSHTAFYFHDDCFLGKGCFIIDVGLSSFLFQTLRHLPLSNPVVA